MKTAVEEGLVERRGFGKVLMRTVTEPAARNRLVVGTVVEAAVAKAKHTGAVVEELRSLKIIFGAFGEPEAAQEIDMGSEMVAAGEPAQAAEETLYFGKSLQGLTVPELVVHKDSWVKMTLEGPRPWVRLIDLVLSFLM